MQNDTIIVTSEECSPICNQCGDFLEEYDIQDDVTICFICELEKLDIED